jgi:hypothetical protein
VNGATLAEFIPTRVVALYLPVPALYLVVRMAVGVRPHACGAPKRVEPRLQTSEELFTKLEARQKQNLGS